MKPFHFVTLALGLIAPSPTSTPAEHMQNVTLASLYDPYMGPSPTQQVAFTGIQLPVPSATGSTDPAARIGGGVVVEVLPDGAKEAAAKVKDDIARTPEALRLAWTCVGSPGWDCINRNDAPPNKKCCWPLQCYTPPWSDYGVCYS